MRRDYPPLPKKTLSWWRYRSSDRAIFAFLVAKYEAAPLTHDRRDIVATMLSTVRASPLADRRDVDKLLVVLRSLNRFPSHGVRCGECGETRLDKLRVTRTHTTTAAIVMASPDWIGLDDPHCDVTATMSCSTCHRIMPLDRPIRSMDSVAIPNRPAPQKSQVN